MKIAVCTPHYADVAAVYARSLSKMLLRTGLTEITYNGSKLYPKLEVFMRRSSVLPRCRNALVKDAVGWGANYLLWIDGDHSFPEESLLRLLSLNLPIVGVNYPRRVHPTRPTAVSTDGELIWTTPDLAERGEVQQVKHLGLGFCLIDMNVIYALSGEGLPLFSLEMIGEGLEAIGEDVYFFSRAQAAGFDIFLDHGLSWHIGHQFDRLITNADALLEPAAE